MEHYLLSGNHQEISVFQWPSLKNLIVLFVTKMTLLFTCKLFLTLLLKGGTCIYAIDSLLLLTAVLYSSTTQVRDTSCMSISTCKENGTDSNYVVIGTFGSGSNIRLLQLPELQMIYEHVNAPMIASPKDVLIVFMEGLLYLMVMLGTFFVTHLMRHVW